MHDSNGHARGIAGEFGLSELPPWFARRRAELARRAPGEAFLWLSPPEATRNGEETHPFRQDSDLAYFTGFEEPDSAALLLTEGGQARLILFARPRDEKAELWNGPRVGTEGLAKFGANQGFPIRELFARLPELLKTSEKLNYRLGRNPRADRELIEALLRLTTAGARAGKSLLPISDPYPHVAELRLRKGPEEIELLSRACEATARAHRAAMEYAKAGMTEHEVEGFIEYQFAREGCHAVGYESIVASGANATVLHYRPCRGRLGESELLLIDAGGELENYTADLTRTFPVGPQFSTEQRAIYDLVLDAQKAAIALVKPGATMPGIHEAVEARVAEGLSKLGLLAKPKDVARVCPHFTSHWLGLDVHDVGSKTRLREAKLFEPGMVLTIEPGIYLRPGDSEVPARFRGIGVRIEDDLLVTEEGARVLTALAPKEREEIEEIRARALGH